MACTSLQSQTYSFLVMLHVVIVDDLSVMSGQPGGYNNLPYKWQVSSTPCSTSLNILPLFSVVDPRMLTFLQENGVQCPAVKLEERGYYVQGRLVSPSAGIDQLLQKTDALEKFPARSEKDVVTVSMFALRPDRRVLCKIGTCAFCSNLSILLPPSFLKCRRHLKQPAKTPSLVLLHWLSHPQLVSPFQADSPMGAST